MAAKFKMYYGNPSIYSLLWYFWVLSNILRFSLFVNMFLYITSFKKCKQSKYAQTPILKYTGSRIPTVLQLILILYTGLILFLPKFMKVMTFEDHTLFFNSAATFITVYKR